MQKPFPRAWLAIQSVLAHLSIAVVLIVTIWLLDRLILLLNGGKEMLAFGRLPFSYLFQAGDVAMIVVFSFYGVAEAIEIMRGQEDENDTEI